MPDQPLLDRLRVALADRDVTEQRMFGGLAFLVGAALVIGSSTNERRRARLKEFGADLAIGHAIGPLLAERRDRRVADRVPVDHQFGVIAELRRRTVGKHQHDARIFILTSDDLRPLTADGKRDMREAARGLRNVVPRLDLLATSPLVRAIETAEILGATYDREHVVFWAGVAFLGFLQITGAVLNKEAP